MPSHTPAEKAKKKTILSGSSHRVGPKVPAATARARISELRKDLARGRSNR